MTDSADRPTGDTPADPGRASVARLLNEQRQHWRGGRRTPVESLLADFDVSMADSEVILDLVYNEVILRQEHGESPDLADYAPRFPHLADQLRMLFEIDGGLAAGLSSPVEETVRWGRVDVGHDNGLAPFEIPGFEVLQQLGRGGMGVVYKARQLALDRIVAIKVIRAGLHADAEDLRRFRTEALAAARLQHPNIAQVHDVDEHDGRPFIVLEYVAGGGLDRHLAAGPVPSADAARLTELLARAVQFAHERGVVHRDLKPANVLVATAPDGPPRDHSDSTLRSDPPASSWTTTASLKITDFGLAKVSDVDAARTQTGHILGTPMYMAPEQAAGRNDDVGPATDVYSLGAILYECLTGHPPFQGQSPLDTLSLVQNQDPVPPRRTQPRVPRDLENICLKCLEKEPGNRYESAQSLADDLTRFLDGKPVLARPVRFWWRGVRWLRRHPTGSTAIVLGFLLLLSAFIAFWQGSDKQSRIDRAVGFALSEAEALRNEHKWTESLAAVRRAEELLQTRYFKSPTLQTRIDDQRRDLSLVQELEKLQLELGQVAYHRHELQPRRSSRDYEIVFSQYGFNICSTDPAEIGQQIRDRPEVVRLQIVSALDDWIAAMESGDATRRAWLERVVATADPDDPWRNRLHEARSRNDIAELKKLASDPDVARQSVNASLTLAGLLTTHGENADAVALLRRAQQIKPSDFWINSRLASYCIGLDPPALDEALRYALVAQALRPDEAGPQFFVGYVLQRLGKTDEAIEAFARAATLHRDFITGLLYLAERYTFESNWGMAEKILRRAASIRPDNALVLDTHAAALRRLKRLDEALEVQREAVRRDLKVAAYHDNLAVILHGLGRRDEAIAVLRTAIKLDPDHAHANHNLGYLLFAAGNTEEAVGYLQKAAKLKPDMAVVQLNLGRALKRQNRLDEAMECFREAIRQQPRTAEAHVSLGLAYETKEDRPAAHASYREAIASEPGNPNAHCFLGKLLLKDGKPSEALIHLRKGHELGSQHPEWNRPSAEWIKEAEEQLAKAGKE